MDRGRLRSLDGLRGIAACGVAFFYHPLLEFNAQAIGDVPAVLLWLRTWGWTLVDLFFLISGYVFAQVYLGRAGGRAGLEQAALPDFAMARFARLYPLHLLLLLVTAVLFASEPANTAIAFVAHLFMMQAFVAPVGHTFDGPSWSLSVEVFCYAIFAVAGARSDRVLRRITVATVLLALGYIVVLGGREGGPWAADCLPRGLLGFFLGQLLWRCREQLQSISTPFLVVVLALGLAIDMGMAWSPLPPLCLLAWPCVLALALRIPALGSGVMVWLGDRSYTIYLVHYPILLCFRPALNVQENAWLAAAGTLGYVAIVLAASAAVYRFFEMPAGRTIRAAWARRREAAKEVATA
ncbi:MAG: acyltransferase [Novosphingobium sp.]